MYIIYGALVAVAFTGVLVVAYVATRKRRTLHEASWLDRRDSGAQISESDRYDGGRR
jgi:hypothetical protein